MFYNIKHLITMLSAFFITTVAVAKTSAGEHPQPKAGITFRENRGQVHDQFYQPRPDVLFGVRAGQMTFYLRNKGVSYQLTRIDRWKETIDPRTRETQKEIESQTIYRVDLNWLNARTDFKVLPHVALPGYNNYYLTNCHTGALHVQSYKSITIENLYEGINLHYYEKDGQLKHDYIVAPGADYHQIRISLEGATIVANEDGSLTLQTPLGKIIEGTPVVFQRGRILKSRWVIENNILSFDVEDHDPDYELVIDPVTRVWATYYGGSDDEFGSACATDAAGNVYVSGRSDSDNGDMIATSGSHQQVTGGFSEAFIAKFNSKGKRLWGTYYGGSKGEASNGCSADVFGNVFMVGVTSSVEGNVIATPGAHQTVYQGVNADAFLVKFNGNGIRLWGTYYGGFGWDIAWSCATDASGNVFMAGDTDAGVMITTPASHQPNYGGGYGDAFLVKFDSTGVRQWGTLYGGNDDEDGKGCATDASGNVYLTGAARAYPSSIIATPGSHQPTFNGGSLDAFLVKFNSAGVRQWGTYYGGYFYDFGYSCATDAAGNVFLCGNTNGTSGTLVATPGSYQTSNAGGSVDAFLVKFNGNGVRQWGTYYGSDNSDDGFSCSTDHLGNVYLGGRTNSYTGMAGSGIFQPLFAGGTYDGYVAKFNGNGARMWGTYCGATSTDYGRSVAADRFGNVYLSGETTSDIGMGTSGSHQDSTGGLLDAFLVKISDCPVLNLQATTDSVVCMGDAINFNVTFNGTGTYTFSWIGPDNYSTAQQNHVITNASAAHAGIYTVTAFNGGCGDISTAEVKQIAPCEGINDLADEGVILVYPNPAADAVNIELQFSADYKLSDMLGREIATGKFSEGVNSLDVCHVEKGCYVLVIGNGGRFQTVKLMVD